MTEENINLQLIGLMFLGNISLIISFILIWSQLLNIRWIKILASILIFIFATSYYVSSIIGAKIFLSSLHFGSVGEWVKRVFSWNKKISMCVSLALLFLILFPFFILILEDYKKVLEIYIYVFLTGIVVGVVTWFSRK